MDGLIIATLVSLYVFAGMIFARWTVRRGALIIQNDAFYGVIALAWPLMIGIIIYLIFNAMVRALVEA